MALSTDKHYSCFNEHIGQHKLFRTGYSGRIELSTLYKLFNGHFDSEKSILLLGKVVGGIDYSVIGIVFFIFGYGIYEPIISDIDPRLQDITDERRNILSIKPLESLKQN